MLGCSDVIYAYLRKQLNYTFSSIFCIYYSILYYSMSDTLKNKILVQRNTSKILDLDIQTEKTKHLDIIEKTKQVEAIEKTEQAIEQTKQAIEQTKQEVEKTKQAIELTKQAMEKTRQYELKLQLKKINLAFLEYEVKKQELQYIID